jgi:hypothetical protein
MATKKTAAAKPVDEVKPMTPTEAIAAASARARVWATPAKQEKAAADKQGG